MVSFTKNGDSSLQPNGTAPSNGKKRQEAASAARFKRLSTIAAITTAIAVVGGGYGVYSTVSANAAINDAKANTQVTLVAKGDIVAGSVLSAENIETKEIPAAFRSSGAIGEDGLTGDNTVVGEQVIVNIPAGSQITSNVFSGTANSSTHLAAVISQDKQAVTIGVDAESGLAGMLHQGDSVRVVRSAMTIDGTNSASTLAESARIVSLDAQMAGTTNQYTSVTVEVAPEEADAIREGQFDGNVTLVLKPIAQDTEAQAGE